MKHKFTCLLSVCLFICSFQSFSQTAKLTAKDNIGCAPLPLVTFTSASSGFSPSAKYTIDFGDGRGDFPFVNTATRSYSLPGTYTATLTVTDGGAPYKDSVKIIAYKHPVADFSVSSPKVCPKTNVDIISTSTPGDGTITSYVWDFGDGNLLPTSADKVQQQYTSARNPSIDVTLKITDQYGCTNSLKKSGIITILAAPKVAFTANPTSVCNEKEPVSFINTTTGGSLPTSYLWTFGDGKTSTETNPTYTYGTKGTFNARLLATSNDGCTDTSKITTLTVANSKSIITLPTLLCLNAKLVFTDSSLPQTNTPVWMLDGAVVLSDKHQYQTTFTDTKQHTLQLINNYGACSDTATKIIQAQAAPVPSPFTVNIAGSCAVPVTATFIDGGVGSTKWEWDFDNANPADFNPTAFDKSVPHTYKTENTYYVKLRVTDGSGCTGEIRQPVVIKKNATTITSTEGAYGCKTLATTFKATSTNPVAQYNWTFSDDNSSSVLDTPHHVFVKLGTYQVKVKIKTTGGCNDSTLYKIQIGSEPSFDFELTTPADTLVCGNKLVYFKVTGDTDKIVGQYYWKFGDVNTYSLLNGPTYSHQYTTDSLFDVSLAIKNHGCNDTITKKALLKVLPPFPKISANINNCDERLKVVFKETSKKAQTYSWNFSDGTLPHAYDSAKRETELTHYFPKTGSYKVVLTTTNDKCTAKDSVDARVLENQKPVLSAANNTFCASDTLHTTVSNIAANPWGSNYKYTVKAVQYSDNQAFTGNVLYPDLTPVIPFHADLTNINASEKSIRFITSSGVYNCLDTTTYISINVSGPEAGFAINNGSSCLSEKILFSDSSKQGGSPITSWHWFFGDSTEQTLTSGGSTFHKYADPGSFKAKLVVTDAQNCKDTAYYSDSALTIKGPKARFSIATNPILPNTPEGFTNLTDSGYNVRVNNTYQWNFGDGASSTSNADNVSHTYKQDGEDTVKLVATSPTTNCSDTATSVIYVKNTKLKFTYSSPDSSKLCAPIQVNFVNESENFEVVSWNFGDGQRADNINTPSHIYNAPGTYKVYIYGYYDDNTYDSSYEYLTIAGPTAALHADVLPGCGSKLVIFTAETQNTTSLSWDFQDGSSSNDSVVSHYYTTPNIYTPVLTVKNGDQCVFSYPLPTPIAIDSIHVDINMDSIRQCHQLLVNFKPAIFSIAKNNNQQVDYSWDFGDGGSKSQDDTASFTYNKADTYQVTFIATSLYGCSDTATATVTYTDPPHATIQTATTEFCENTPQTFTAVKSNSNDALIYHWQFENGTSDLQNPSPQTFTAAWKDSIRLISEYNNCFDTVYQSLIIHSQPQVVYSVSDSLICSGTAVTFKATPLTNNPQDHFTYQWNFGNGANSADSATSYTYPKAGVYSPILHVDNMGQCSGDFKPVVKMLIDSLNIGIDKDSVIGCHQLLVNFKPAIFGVAKDNGGEVKYEWKFGEGSTSTEDTTSFTYSKPNKYQVTFSASTANGCSAIASAEVNFTDAFPVSISGQPEFCENTPQVFTAVKANSNDALTYDWTFENSTSTLQNPPAQTFTAAWKDSIRLVVDRNGCKDTAYYKSVVHGIPDISVSLSDSVSCLGKTIAFTANNRTTSPEPIDYTWNFGNGNTTNQQTASYLFTTAGSYPVSLTATLTSGCSKEVKDTVLINPTPIASAQTLQDACVGSAVKFNGSSNIASAQYNWHFSDGSTSTEQNPVKTYTSATQGSYYLIVTKGNCDDTTTSQTFAVHSLPVAKITPLTPRACLGDSVQITAHNGQSYQWLTASSITNSSVADPFVFPSADTKYVVQVTDNYGCKNIDSVLVKITQPQKVTVISPVNVCIGSKANLTASGADVYNWTDGSNLTSTNIANPSTKDSATSRTYTVAGSDSYGCFTDTTKVDVIVRNKPVVDAGANQTVPAGTNVQLSASADQNNVTWKWQPPLYLSCTNCLSPVSKLRESMTYTAQATSSYGCKGYDTIRVNVICKESLVDVPQIFSPNGDGRNDKFHILSQGIKTITHFVIYGRNGNKLFERNNVSPFSNDASWDGMSNHQYMPTGTYIYIIQAVCDAGEVYNLQGTVTLVR